MQGPLLRKYGVQTTIDFPLFETDGVNFKTDAVHAAGDTKIMKNEGAEANTANAFTDQGQGYSLVLSATEMQAARIVVYVADQDSKVWLDTAMVIETYGHASAQHGFDLGTDAATAVLDALTADHNVAASFGAAIQDCKARLTNKTVVKHGASNQAVVYEDDASTVRTTMTPTKNLVTNETTVTPS